MILPSKAKNDFGIYYQQMFVDKKQKVSFYYVAKNNDDLPLRPKEYDKWSKYFHENRIVYRTRKRAYEPLQCIWEVTPVPPDDDDTIMPSPAELHEKAHQQSGTFWQDKKTQKLFNSADAENSLISWIKRLKVAKFNATELKKLVNQTETHPLATHQAFAIQQKVMLLWCAYQYALEDMPDKVSWQACCERSIEFWKNVVGVEKVPNYQTIQDWNIYFWNEQKFPHPNPFVKLKKEVIPKLLQVFPEAQDKICCWANNKLEVLNSDATADYIQSDLLLQFYSQYVNEMEDGEMPMSQREFMQSMNLSTLDTKTAYRWLKNLGFSFDVQKKYTSMISMRIRRILLLKKNS